MKGDIHTSSEGWMHRKESGYISSSACPCKTPSQSRGQFALSLHGLVWIKICFIPNHFLKGYCSNSMVNNMVFNMCFQENPLGEWIKLCCPANWTLLARPRPKPRLLPTPSFTRCDPTSLLSLLPACLGVILGPACSLWALLLDIFSHI